MISFARYLSKFSILVVAFYPQFSFANELALPKHMAVLGDSMSEGMLSGFSLEKKFTLGTVSDLLWIASTAEDKSARLEGYRRQFARRDLSWAAGDNKNDLVNSHYERLKEMQPDLTVRNFSVSGDDSSQMLEQLKLLLAAEDERGEFFDYVTIFIGANDLGASQSEWITPPLQYIANVESAIRRLLEKSIDRRILVVALPEIHEVFEKSEDITVYKVWGRKVSCGDMRRKIYKNYTVFRPYEEEAYAYTKDIIVQYRNGLFNLVQRLNEEFHGDRLKYAENFGRPMNIRKALSVDCFHPSEWGQAELAEKTWARGFWPDVKNSDLALWKED